MIPIQQGTVLHLADIKMNVLVLSREYFNKTGMLVVCPVRDKAGEAALHIPIKAGDGSGIAILEQMRSIDIQARHYKVLGELHFAQIQNIADAVQDIFDYIPYER